MRAFDAAWAVLKGVGKEQTRLPQFYNPSDLEDYYEHKYRQDVIDSRRSTNPRKRNLRRPRPVPHRVLHSKDADTGRNEFMLVDEDGRELSLTRAPDEGHSLSDIVSHTPQEHWRKGYYRTLLNSLIQGGFEVNSFSRNQNSHPFHRNFQHTLPPNTSFSDMTDEKFGRRRPRKRESQVGISLFERSTTARPPCGARLSRRP